MPKISWQKPLHRNSKAFYSVNHQIINHKLFKYGVNCHFHQWIMNYLSDHFQKTVVNGKSSNKESIDTGVPQWSLIGPRAFSITVNDCPDISEDFDTDLFADDNTSTCSDTNLDTMFVKLQCMSNELSSWSVENHLSIHPLKSTLISKTVHRSTTSSHSGWRSTCHKIKCNVSRSYNW